MTKNVTILGGKHNCQNICSIQVYKSPCHNQTWDLCFSSLIHVNVYPLRYEVRQTYVDILQFQNPKLQKYMYFQFRSFSKTYTGPWPGN